MAERHQERAEELDRQIAKQAKYPYQSARFRVVVDDTGPWLEWQSPQGWSGPWTYRDLNTFYSEFLWDVLEVMCGVT
jgi:hypothetical protein